MNQSTEHPQQTGRLQSIMIYTADHDEEADHDFHAEDYTICSMEDIAKEAENIVNSANAGAQAKNSGTVILSMLKHGRKN